MTGLLTALYALGAVLAAGPGGITLSDVEGKRQSVLSASSRRPTALLFLGHDCPISNKYSPEINRIVQEYGKKVSFYIVYPDPALKRATAARHHADFGYRCPALLDPKHLLVKRAGATVTPESALFDAAGKLLYRGRIDDIYYDFGKRRNTPTTRDLRMALGLVLSGKPAKLRTTKAIGCFIPGRV